MYTSNSQDPNPVVNLEIKNAIGLAIRNQPTKTDYIYINNLITSAAKKSELICILLDIKTPKRVATDQIIKELKPYFKHLQQTVKIAVLIADNAAINIGELAIPDMEITRFPREDKAQAIQWLTEES